MAISIDQRTKISTDQRLSRYVQGGETDKYNNRLGWWERFQLPPSDDDIIYTIQNSESKRPDLIAKRVYNQVRLSWLVLQYNNIVDIEAELIAGKVIRLPTQQRVTSQITSHPVGGKPVT